MRIHPLFRVILVLGLAVLACTSVETLPSTAVPTDRPEPTPTPVGGGVDTGFNLTLRPTDAEGLSERVTEIYQELFGSGGEVDRDVLIDAYQSLADYTPVGGRWQFVGPAPVEQQLQAPGYIPSGGRTNGFAIDPRDSNVVYAAVSAGGIWKTTDGGQTWLPLTGNQVPVIYGGIVMDPQDPDTLYALLGEFDGQLASDHGYLANGIMRTHDGGQSWELVGADVFNAAAVTALVFGPDGTLYASSGQLGVYEAPPDQAEFGIFKSEDGGDTWEMLLNCNEVAACNPQDLFPNTSVSARLGGIGDLDISSDGTLYASVCNVECYGTYLIRSTDGGASWEMLDFSNALSDWEAENGYSLVAAPGADDAPYIEGLELAVAPTDPNLLIAGGGLNLDYEGEPYPWSFAMRSTDAGDTWEWLPEVGDYCTIGGISPQCDYDNEIEFDPTDASIVYIGGAASNDEDTGYNMWIVIRSADGGDTWFDMTPPEEGSLMHSDVQGITIDPNDSNVVWVGSDGGIWRTADASAEPPQWDFMGRGVGTLLFVDIGLHPTDPSYFIGGLQDNSCAFTTDGGQEWQSTTCGGDGATTAVDPFEPSIVYANTYPPYVFSRNEDGGVGTDYASEPWVTLTDGLDVDNEPWLFRPPFTVDPYNEGVIYIYSSRVYRTEDRGDTWEPISDYLTTDEYASIQALAIAPSDPQVLYVGTTEGTVFVTTDGGSDWSEITDSQFPARVVRRVAVDPNDANIAYVVFGGFDVQSPDAPGHIFHTADGGQSWENISLNLPDAPLTSIVIDARPDYAGVYVGGALGVWVLQDGSDEWLPYGTGMPFTIVTDLELNPETGVMGAGTWGRSMWTIQMP